MDLPNLEDFTTWFNNHQAAEILNLVYFLLYVVLIMAIFGRIGYRYAEYKLVGMTPPYLIRRDLVLWGAMGIFIGLLLYFRVANVQGLRDNFLWINGSAFLLLGAMGYYAYVEWFVVERGDRKERKQTQEKDAADLKQFREDADPGET